MPSITSLLEALRHDYPDITLEEGVAFEWSPRDRIITYDTGSSTAVEQLLHELAHAELGHMSYERDIELIAHERDAWHRAKTTLASRYNVVIADDIIDDNMDTYRDWMHSRSVCPRCEANGLQTGAHTYTCVMCRSTWEVNDARQSRLYRRIHS